MELSIFDALGPIMIGPSSSHTAGAVRIGWVARQAFGEEPTAVEISFHPSLLQTYKGHRTDTGIVAGSLGFREYDEAIRNSLRIARGKGISIQVKQAPDGAHPNIMALVLNSKKGDPFSLKGISVGGGSILVSEIDGYRTALNGQAHVILIWHKPCDTEKWGILGNIETSTKANINQELTIITSDNTPDKESLKSIVNIGEVCKVRYIPPLTRFVRKLGDIILPFRTLSDLEKASTKDSLVNVVLKYEAVRTGAPILEIREEMVKTFEAMKESVNQGLENNFELIGGFTDGKDGKRLWKRAQGESLTGSVFTKSLARALAAAEANAAMGKVVASPTAGSAGVVAGVVLTLGEEKGLSKDLMVDSLIVAAGIGVCIGHSASFSGAVGGCQAEIGAASAMAASSAAFLGGGGPATCLHASAMALKNLLGLACDPACGPVEVPCIKRNAGGVANALAAAEMALAGIRSIIPPGEVVMALRNVQEMMPEDLRDNTKGGLGSTPTAARMKRIWADKIKEMKE